MSKVYEGRIQCMDTAADAKLIFIASLAFTRTKLRMLRYGGMAEETILMIQKRGDAIIDTETVAFTSSQLVYESANTLSLLTGDYLYVIRIVGEAAEPFGKPIAILMEFEYA